MEIKKDNVATYGLTTWEQTGTIAIDFANYLDRLSTLKGIDLQELSKERWYQAGFRFGKSLIENTDTIQLDIVLSKRGDNDVFQYGYVTRAVNKADFLSLIVNFTAYVSNQVHFENDDISFRQLENIEE
jgi:hypothetical protein